MNAPRSQRVVIPWISKSIKHRRRFRACASDVPPHPAPIRRMFNAPIQFMKIRYAVGIVATITAMLSAFGDSTAFEVRAQGVAADRAALEALYDATDGDNWADNTNWKSSEALGQWFGVDTDDDGRVVSINLQENNLNGTIPAAIGDLENLEDLHLWVNSLSGSLPAEIGDLANLTSLDLGENSLSGSIPSQLGNATNLEFLDIWNNSLSGSIPTTLGNLTNLRMLSFADNSLTGSIPSQLGDIAELRTLSLWGNSLTGSIPSDLADLENLEYLSLGGNSLSGSIPSDLADLQNLKSMHLADNLLSGSIPTELMDLSNLEELDLDTNSLTGTIPSQLGDLTNLTSLDLSANSLTGSIPSELGSLTLLEHLSLHSNSFSGSIPTGIWGFTNLNHLDLSENAFSGSLPTEIGQLQNLTFLALQMNSLSGTLPSQLGNLQNLTSLDLANNSFSGFIPTELGNLSNLEFLWMDGNSFTGSIPSQLGGLSNLHTLTLFSNSLSGTIPSELANLKQLHTIGLSNNSLSGSIPRELGALTNLEALSLWNNSLIGSIPPELANLQKLRDLWLDNNSLAGTVPQQFGNLANLETLHLHSNQLSGQIPPQLGNLTKLRNLWLADNSFEGPIPADIGDLQNLEILWLNDNSLSGPIPVELQNLSGLNAPHEDGLSRLSLHNNPGLCTPADIQPWLTGLNNDIPLCDGLKAALAQRFAPILRMHPDEIVYPRTVNVMIDDSVLRDSRGNQLRNQPNTLTVDYLSQFNQNSHGNYYLDFLDVTPPFWIGEVLAANTPGFGPVEIYGSYDTAESRISQDQYDVTVYVDVELQTDYGALANQLVPNIEYDQLMLRYWMFYPLDRNHEGDWEFVQLEFDALGETDQSILLSRILGNNIAPSRVVYAAHGIPDFECVNSSRQLTRRDEHPEVYVARGSHASYYQAATTNFGLTVSDLDGFLDDTSADGDELLPTGLLPQLGENQSEYVLSVISTESSPWFRFAGKWGEQIERRIGPSETLALGHSSGPIGPFSGPLRQHFFRSSPLIAGAISDESQVYNCGSTGTITPFQIRPIGKRSVTVDKDPNVPAQTRVEFSWPAIDKLAAGEEDLEIDFSSIPVTSTSPDIETLIVIAEDSDLEVLSVIDITLSESLRRREATVCIPPPAGFVGEFQVFHYDEEEGDWVPLETFIDEQDGSICALTTSFSLFALVGERQLGFAGSHIPPARYVSHIQPSITSVTLSPADTVRLSTNIFGQQDILDNSLAENLAFEWDLDGTIIESDGHEIEFTAPESPGRYTVTATLPDTECNAKHGSCSAEFNIRVRRPRSIDTTVDITEPVNPAGQIPIVIPGADGTQHAVFTPVEGGSVKSGSCTFEAPSGAINDNEFIGIAVQTTDDPTQLTPVDDPRFVTHDSQCNLSAVDNAGTNIADYRLRVAGDVCIPLPDEYRSNAFDIRLLSVDNGQTQILATRVIINDPGIPLKLCGKLSTLPNTVAAALPANLAPKIPTPETDSDEITIPDTGPSAIPPMAMWFILVLGIALLVFVTTVKLKNHNFRRSRR